MIRNGAEGHLPPQSTYVSSPYGQVISPTGTRASLASPLIEHGLITNSDINLWHVSALCIASHLVQATQKSWQYFMHIFVCVLHRHRIHSTVQGIRYYRLCTYYRLTISATITWCEASTATPLKLGPSYFSAGLTFEASQDPGHGVFNLLRRTIRPLFLFLAIRSHREDDRTSDERANR